MTREGGVMDRVEQGQTCSRGNIHAIPEVEVAVVKGPVFESRAGEERGSICEVRKGVKD